jgi:Flp pilus assembly protein TadD
MNGAERKNHYQTGLALFERGRFADAARRFERVVAAEGQRALRPHMRALSFLGLSRALADRPRPEDIAACERAAQMDDFDPIVHANLGHIYLLTGKTSRALAILERARRIDGANPRIRALFARYDRRRPPVIRRLGRDHLLNRSLGRLRLLLAGQRRLRKAG